jgi:PAS domain-containing protein
MAMNAQAFDEQKAQYLRAIFDTIPQPTFIVDEDVGIRDFNTAAEQFLGDNPAAALQRPGGEAFHCIHADRYGCGKAEPCKDCVIRNSVRKAMQGATTCRELHRAELRTGATTVPITLLVTASLLPYTESPRVLLILENVSSLLKLRPSAGHARRSPSPAHAG